MENGKVRTSRAISELIRRVGTETTYLFLFATCGNTLYIVIMLHSAAYVPLDSAPLIVRFAYRAADLLFIVGVMFWCSTIVALYKCTRAIKAAGFQASWSWLVLTVILFEGGAFVALAFYLVQRKRFQA